MWVAASCCTSCYGLWQAAAVRAQAAASSSHESAGGGEWQQLLLLFLQLQRIAQAASVQEWKHQRLLLFLRRPCPSQKARFFKLLACFLSSFLCFLSTAKWLSPL